MKNLIVFQKIDFSFGRTTGVELMVGMYQSLIFVSGFQVGASHFLRQVNHSVASSLRIAHNIVSIFLLRSNYDSRHCGKFKG